MSGFAMFSLKDPSFPIFEKRWSARDHNLHAFYHIENVSSDSTVREILDEVSPHAFRSAFRYLRRAGKMGLALTVLFKRECNFFLDL